MRKLLPLILLSFSSIAADKALVFEGALGNKALELRWESKARKGEINLGKARYDIRGVTPGENFTARRISQGLRGSVDESIEINFDEGIVAMAKVNEPSLVSLYANALEFSCAADANAVVIISDNLNPPFASRIYCVRLTRRSGS